MRNGLLIRRTKDRLTPTRRRCFCVALLFASVAACSPIRLVNQLSPSDHYERVSGRQYGSLARQTVDVYMPRSTTSLSAMVVFFYGGGWRDGNRQDYEFVASSLTKAGYVVIIPDYRLFPEAVFPAFVEDAAAAVSWALQNAEDYGANPNELYLMGHSAGAHIAALLSFDPRYLAEHDVDTDAVRGFVGLSGPYDFLPLESGYLLEVFPEGAREASQPINFVSAEAPPTLLLHGTGDDVVDPANSERLAKRLSDYGVDVTLKLYQGAGHARVAAALAPPLDFTAETLEDTRQFLDSRTKRGEERP